LSYGLPNQQGDSAVARRPNGGGGNGNIEAARQRRLLETIQVVSFAANSTTVTPFGTVTLSWQVVVPTALNFPVSIIVNGQEVGTSGTLAITVVTQTEVQLGAASPLASVTLKTLTLTLDQSGCQTSTPPALDVTGPLQQALTDRFSGSSSFTLRGSGITVTPFDGYAAIAIPLDLRVPDWFDAAMDITIQLGVTMADGSSVAVQPYTNVHITWTWLQDLAGCTEFGQKLSQAFMSDIVENEIAPQFAQGINGWIQQAATDAQQNDPQHRTFALTAFSFGSDMSITVCPRG
jgi:hypothetical protein